jgi:hypothetical protein
MQTQCDSLPMLTTGPLKRQDSIMSAVQGGVMQASNISDPSPWMSHLGSEVGDTIRRDTKLIIMWWIHVETLRDYYD